MGERFSRGGSNFGSSEGGKGKKKIPPSMIVKEGWGLPGSGRVKKIVGTTMSWGKKIRGTKKYTYPGTPKQGDEEGGEKSSKGRHLSTKNGGEERRVAAKKKRTKVVWGRKQGRSTGPPEEMITKRIGRGGGKERMPGKIKGGRCHKKLGRTLK